MIIPSTSLLLLSFSSLALAHGTEHVVRRHQGMEIVRRQSNDTATTAPATSAAGAAAAGGSTTSAAAANAASTTDSNPIGSLFSSITNGLNPATSSATVGAAVSTTETTASTTSTSSSVTSTSTSSSATSASTLAPTVVTATSTLSRTISSASSSSSSSSSASASATAASDKASSSSSGIGHATLIIIIVVASSVAGVAAIWTLIRKTKFSPSRRFEAKLAPIDFVPGDGGKNEYDGDFLGSHARSMSDLNGGYAPSLSRSGSEKGSLRGMSESGSRGYNGSAYGGHQQQYGAPPSAYGSSQAGYPAEQYSNYSDLQRGASNARSQAPSNLAYNYDAQQRSQSPYGRY